MSNASDDGLSRGFGSPSPSVRPWVYWMWMDGNLTREGITADLESMQQAGLGGVIIMEVNVGIPQGPVKFMSPEWRQLFKHAVNEAERLGLEITLNAGPGWTGSGGPWVKPEQSMQHIVASSLEVVGPKHADEDLTKPKRRPAFFGDGALPPEQEKAKGEFYRDVCVLAFPSPAAKYEIADIDEKGLYIRAPYSSQPRVKPFLPSPAEFPHVPTGAAIDSTHIVDISDRLTAEGRLTWDVPPGNWTILRFGRTSTGANTRPAPKPGLGLECDKLDKAALDAHFESFIGTLVHDLGPSKVDSQGGWKFLHIDSWEMGAQNWTAAFPAEFRQRRGYEPLRYLPAVTGRVVESLEKSERFLWDVRQTVQELIVENHAQHLKELGRRHGLGLSIEPYDMTPCADMNLGAVADVPMCEFWLYGFNGSYSVFEAASIAHTCGRPVVAAESFTSSDSEKWQAYPTTMKPLGDWAFCAGVNRVVFHRYQHQPWLDRAPGMTMGPYGVHWERTQTWWDLEPAYHAYLSRCQFLLRQGRPVADICYLVAEGAPQVFRPAPSATSGNPPDRLGYNFDGIAPDTLLTRMTVKNGLLVLPDGLSYRLLVLPERDTITPRLLRKVRELVEAGATVIGPRPLKSPSLANYPDCDAEVKKLAADLWGDCDDQGVKEHRFGKGRLVWQRPSANEPRRPDESQEALRHVKWIWHNEGNPAAQAPLGKRYFRRVFNLGANRPVASAGLVVTADNSFKAWVNGHRVAEGDNFTELYTADLKKFLRPGTNLVAILAENGGDAPNPAGLIVSLRVRFTDGPDFEVASDQQWQSALNAPAEWASISAPGGNWAVARELGPFGMAPWNEIVGTYKEPDQYGDFSVPTKLLQKMGVPPDFECVPGKLSTLNPQPSTLLRYTHRHDFGFDIYFVANLEDREGTAQCLFRVSGKQPELWDPVTGETRDLREFAFEQGRTRVPLHFEPHQSCFVVFRRSSAGSKSPSSNWEPLTPVADLSAGPWEVSFDPKWGGPAKVTFSHLEDWTGRQEEGIKFYSGKALYRKNFVLPRSVPVSQQHLYLDLGAVKNLARIRLNGRDLGVVWCNPWRVDISAAVKPDENRLEIEVVNLWPNRLIGDEQFPPDCQFGAGGNLARFPDWLLQGQSRPSSNRYTFTTWKHFSKDSPLLPSGLLGPVRLLGQ